MYDKLKMNIDLIDEFCYDPIDMYALTAGYQKERLKRILLYTSKSNRGISHNVALQFQCI